MDISFKRESRVKQEGNNSNTSKDERQETVGRAHLRGGMNVGFNLDPIKERFDSLAHRRDSFRI